MATLHYNYAAAFVEFSRNTPVEEISTALAIPIELLHRRIFKEGWGRLVGGLTTACVPVRAERDLEKIRLNRERCLFIAQELQTDLLEIISKLRGGTLRIEKTTSKGETVIVDPSIKDRVDLANYAKTVADLAYKALGDSPESKNGEGGGGPSSWAGAPGHITIILPPVVAQPRAERAYDVAGEVVAELVPWRSVLPGAVVEAELLPEQGNGSGTHPLDDTILEDAMTTAATTEGETGKDCRGEIPCATPS